MQYNKNKNENITNTGINHKYGLSLRHSNTSKPTFLKKTDTIAIFRDRLMSALWGRT